MTKEYLSKKEMDAFENTLWPAVDAQGIGRALGNLIDNIGQMGLFTRMYQSGRETLERNAPIVAEIIGYDNKKDHRTLEEAFWEVWDRDSKTLSERIKTHSGFLQDPLGGGISQDQMNIAVQFPLGRQNMKNLKSECKINGTKIKETSDKLLLLSTRLSQDCGILCKPENERAFFPKIEPISKVEAHKILQDAYDILTPEAQEGGINCHAVLVKATEVLGLPPLQLNRNVGGLAV